MSPCPPEEQLCALAEGRLSPADRTRLQEHLHLHLDICPSCRTVLAALYRGDRALSPPSPLHVPDCPAQLLGHVLAGKYRLIRLIGQGGMGVVYEAECLCQGLPGADRVAIKLIKDRWAPEPAVMARARREWRAVTALRHPGIVRLLDVEDDRSPGTYLVMEFLDGIDGHQLAGSTGAEIEVAVEIGIQALDALALAHDSGVVHRDIKPANLFLAWGPDGRARVKLLDFGLVKLLESAGDARLRPTSNLTEKQTALGTVPYMAPEQALDSSTARPACDIYSIGATLFELLTGQRVVERDSAIGILGAVARGEIRRHPGALRTAVPAEVDAVVARALRYEPGDRFASAREMQAALLLALTRFCPPDRLARRQDWLGQAVALAGRSPSV